MDLARVKGNQWNTQKDNPVGPVKVKILKTLEY